MSNKFQIQAPFSPAGDQPKAIKKLTGNLLKKQAKHQTLLGVTGSGKTLTMAHVIQNLNEPALILAPNKTLAAQLFAEFKELFPENAVEYFVSYYDYYQPEAFIPSTETYIEKDASINDQIDLMRHSATRSLLERDDAIIVSSVSCIYGLGSPKDYLELKIALEINQKLKPEQLMRDLVEMQYKREDENFDRGAFRVRGDTVEIFPAYEENRAVRIEFFGDYIERISLHDPLDGEMKGERLRLNIYPGSHYVSTKETLEKAVRSIKRELKSRLKILDKAGKNLERERLEKRTVYDLEIINEMGSCPGIENYSRHLSGRKAGEPPPTLIDYFYKRGRESGRGFLAFIDESHISVPQARGMFLGDRRRKETLVEHGFRLPSALDNRPLNFREFENMLDKTIYVSATPGEYERKKSPAVVEQIIRPTGLLDPKISIRPAASQAADLLGEIKKRAEKGERVLVTALTKKAARDLTDHYQDLGIKIRRLDGDVKTIERTEILRDLRAGVFDVLAGINLLREGLDLPEVSLVAVLDADREGFLRSAPSLIQIMGRAARHINGQAILYADRMTDSIKQAAEETERRRRIQKEHNRRFKIRPKSVKKSLGKGLMELYGFSAKEDRFSDIQTPEALREKIAGLKTEMSEAARELDFERAARLRDQIKELQLKEMEER